MENIEKGHYGFAEGMLLGSAMCANSKGSKQVDWDKVKEFVESNKENLESVTVGLAEDWSYTSGEVWNSKEGYIPKENTYVYASSKWATPAMDVEYKSGASETLEVWINGDNSDSYFE